MTANDTCPDDSALDDLIAGRLAEKKAAAVTMHLDQCGRCQQRLLSLESQPEIEVPFPELRQREALSSHLREAIAKVKSMREPSPSPDNRHDTAELNSDIAAHATQFTNDGYELLRLIGRGGMGVVYLARESSLDRIVAIKVLSPLLASEASARQRFLREARSAAAVVHPNVITIHAVSDKPPLPYLVMEFIEGVSLQQQLDRGGSISIDNVVRIGRQIAAGLAAAHAKGVVHRDVKPGNILLNAQTGKVLLGDFGLARAAENSQLTRTGTIVGTPAFVAPEALESSEPPDHRADLFSLGVVLYAMCNGDSPFQSDSLLGTLHRVSSVNPVDLSDSAPHVPPWLSGIVMRLLAKDPNDRYQSASEVREALGSWQSGLASTSQASASASVANQSFPELAVTQSNHSSAATNKKQKATLPWWSYLAAGIAMLVPIGIFVFWPEGNGREPRFLKVNRFPTQATLQTIAINLLKSNCLILDSKQTALLKTESSYC